MHSYVMECWQVRSVFVFHLYQLEQLVARTHLVRHTERHTCAFLRCLHGVSVVVNLLNGDIHHSCRRTCYEHLVANGELAGLAGELSHAELGEVFHAAAHVNLALGGVRAVVLVPFAQTLALIVAVPESAVEHGGEAFVPCVLLLFGERAVENGGDGFLVAPVRVRVPQS